MPDRVYTFQEVLPILLIGIASGWGMAFMTRWTLFLRWPGMFLLGLLLIKQPDILSIYHPVFWPAIGYVIGIIGYYRKQSDADSPKEFVSAIWQAILRPIPLRVHHHSRSPYPPGILVKEHHSETCQKRRMAGILPWHSLMAVSSDSRAYSRRMEKHTQGEQSKKRATFFDTPKDFTDSNLGLSIRILLGTGEKENRASQVITNKTRPTTTFAVTSERRTEI